MPLLSVQMEPNALFLLPGRKPLQAWFAVPITPLALLRRSVATTLASTAGVLATKVTNTLLALP